MTYRRVIPRDLFNEGNLLMCLGKLKVLLDNLNMDHVHFDLDDENGEPFAVVQNPTDGSIACRNIQLLVGPNSDPVGLYRPLNAREPFPLYAFFDDSSTERVFTSYGELSTPFLTELENRSKGMKDCFTVTVALKIEVDAANEEDARDRAMQFLDEQMSDKFPWDDFVPAWQTMSVRAAREEEREWLPGDFDLDQYAVQE